MADTARRSLPRDACCRRCGYSLRGLTTPRCAECGQAFDPSNIESFVQADRPHRFVWEPAVSFLCLLLAWVLPWVLIEPLQSPSLQRDGAYVTFFVLALSAGFACKGFAVTREMDRVGCAIILALALVTAATFAQHFL